jgi:hypothetical protein
VWRRATSATCGGGVSGRQIAPVQSRRRLKGEGKSAKAPERSRLRVIGALPNTVVGGSGRVGGPVKFAAEALSKAALWSMPWEPTLGEGRGGSSRDGVFAGGQSDHSLVKAV